MAPWLEANFFPPEENSHARLTVWKTKNRRPPLQHCAGFIFSIPHKTTATLLQMQKVS